VIVLPAEWHGDRQRLAGRVTTLTALSSPVLLTGSGAARRGRVVLLASVQRPAVQWVDTARVWSHWLRTVSDSDMPDGCVPDMVSVHDSGGLRAANAVLAEAPWAVIMQQSMLAEVPGVAVSPAVFSVLAQAESHVLIVPDGAQPPLRTLADRGGSRLVSAGA